MNTRRLTDAGAGILLVLLLLGCASQSEAPEPSSTPGSSSTPTPTEEPRMLVTCTDAEGNDLGTFPRLEEAWASTNYVRIHDCEAFAEDGVELTDDETAIADVATEVDGDAVARYLRVLEACVRLTHDTGETLEAAPTSLLDAALELCPEAPHAGLMEDELTARGAR